MDQTRSKEENEDIKKILKLNLKPAPRDPPKASPSKKFSEPPPDTQKKKKKKRKKSDWDIFRSKNKGKKWTRSTMSFQFRQSQIRAGKVKAEESEIVKKKIRKRPPRKEPKKKKVEEEQKITPLEKT